MAQRAQLAKIARRQARCCPPVPWIGSTMIAAMSFVVSAAILLRRKSTQCQWHDGNVLPNAQRAHDAYGLEYVPGRERTRDRA
mgnify:CR=1 FL=1